MRMILTVLAAVLMCAGTGQAQERGAGGFDPGPMLDRIFQSDKNADGKIARDEADERLLQMFDRTDGDKDGFVTREEARIMFEQGPPDGGSGPGGRGGTFGPPGQGGPGGPRGMMALFPIIQALDANKNGELSTEEIANAVAALKSLDKNQDGQLTNEEMMPDPAMMFGGGRGGRGGPGGMGGRSGPPKRPTFDDAGG